MTASIIQILMPLLVGGVEIDIATENDNLEVTSQSLRTITSIEKRIRLVIMIVEYH